MDLRWGEDESPSVTGRFGKIPSLARRFSRQSEFDAREVTTRSPDGLTGINIRRLLIGMVGGQDDVWTRSPLIGFGWERR